jgi:hypothetical protein
MPGEGTLAARWSPHPETTNFYPIVPRCLIVALM